MVAANIAKPPPKREQGKQALPRRWAGYLLSATVVMSAAPPVRAAAPPPPAAPAENTAVSPSLRELAVLRARPFERMDTDGNGELSDVELPLQLISSFSRADANHSGGIDRTELDAEFKRLEARLTRGPALDPDKPPRTWAEVDRALDRLVAHHELEGAALLVGRGEKIIFEGYAGSYNADSLVNMASASKWPGGAAIAAAVAEGKLDPDAPLSSWRPGLIGTPKANLTLTQLMSFTAGAAAIGDGTPDIALDPRIDIQEAADRLLQFDLVAPPGTEFAYGGWTQQVGAAWAVAATGEPFVKLWNRTVGGPARMTSSHFGHPQKSRDGLDLPNPNLQSGLWTTPRDYARFLMMMSTGGKVGGKQVYPAAAIKLIETDHAAGLPHRWRSAGAEAGRSYGFAAWCETTRPDGSCAAVSSGGAWGTLPWIDREKDLWGLFFVFDRGPRLREDLSVLRKAAEAIVVNKGD
ncbi:serine hydrolase [Phenylobacterium sp.]|uniref:serine hydrolase n=1 Tax=Phenylobacterium sp. TaxID=1871053 RepID=UPI0025DEF834|nr:serine hydrolase [Phenylobacterium sp.]MBX3483023.1 serine hydrolase [Phenylobacterium sp.]